MGLHTKQIFLSSTIREFAGKNNAICIKISFSRRWMGRGWVDRKAGLLRCRLALGEAPGSRRGAAAFGGRGAALGAAPRPAKQKSEAGAKGPPRSFRALRAQPPPPSAGFFTNAKAASCNSLAHWASASLLPPLAALGSRSSQRPFRGAEKAASSNAERQRKSPAPQSMGRAT